MRNFIRKALDLDPIPSGLSIPMQGPARLSNSGGRGKEGARQDGRGGSMGTGAGGGMVIVGSLDGSSSEHQ